MRPTGTPKGASSTLRKVDPTKVAARPVPTSLSSDTLAGDRVDGSAGESVLLFLCTVVCVVYFSGLACSLYHQSQRMVSYFRGIAGVSQRRHLSKVPERLNLPSSTLAVHPKMKTSGLVVSGALSRMAKVRGACDKQFWISD